VEGSVVVREALKSGVDIDEIFVEKGLWPDLIDRAAGKGVRVTEVAEHVLRALTDAATPQGIVATAHIESHDLNELAAHAGLLVLLADVRDPGNAGTLVRSAAAAGASGVVFARGAVDPFHPKTVRASAGALFHIPVVRGVSLEEAVAASRAGGLAVLEADQRSDTSYEDIDMTRRITFLLGNEAWGLPPESKHLVDGSVAIPMSATVESLNVGIAGSILLFEAARRRRLSSAPK
jgi:RNA methyltransferase, TrmH family